MSLTLEEIDKAESVINRMIQSESFSRELKDLSHGGRVQAGSQLAALAPFLDETGIIRVGGRLNCTNLPYDPKASDRPTSETLHYRDYTKTRTCQTSALWSSTTTGIYQNTLLASFRKEGSKKSNEEMHIVF